MPSPRRLVLALWLMGLSLAPALADEPASLLEPPPDDPFYESPQARPDRPRGERLVFKDRLTPHWFAADRRFWYRNDLPGGAREFLLVDAEKGTRAPAFDHARLAGSLAKAADDASLKAEKLPST